MEPPIEEMLAPSVTSIRFDRFSFDDVYHYLAIVHPLSRYHFRTRFVHDSEGCERVSDT